MASVEIFLQRCTMIPHIQSCHSNVKKTEGQKCNINSSDSKQDKTGLNIIKFIDKNTRQIFVFP